MTFVPFPKSVLALNNDLKQNLLFVKYTLPDNKILDFKDAVNLSMRISPSRAFILNFFFKILAVFSAVYFGFYSTTIVSYPFVVV